MITKTCTKCGEEKPLEDFGPSARGRHGRRAQCRPCFNHKQRQNQRARRRKESLDTPPEVAREFEKPLDDGKCARWACMAPRDPDSIFYMCRDHDVAVGNRSSRDSVPKQVRCYQCQAPLPKGNPEGRCRECGGGFSHAVANRFRTLTAGVIV